MPAKNTFDMDIESSPELKHHPHHQHHSLHHRRLLFKRVTVLLISLLLLAFALVKFGFVSLDSKNSAIFNSLGNGYGKDLLPLSGSSGQLGSDTVLQAVGGEVVANHGSSGSSGSAGNNGNVGAKEYTDIGVGKAAVAGSGSDSKVLNGPDLKLAEDLSKQQHDSSSGKLSTPQAALTNKNDKTTTSSNKNGISDTGIGRNGLKNPSISKSESSDKGKNVYHDDDYSASNNKFDPSAEFKAIVALSPVVVFTWDNPKLPIPKDHSSEYGKRDSDSDPLKSSNTGDRAGSSTSLNGNSATHQINSKDLLKTLSKHYQITPVPTYVSLDRHPHFKELAIYINKLYYKLNNDDGYITAESQNGSGGSSTINKGSSSSASKSKSKSKIKSKSRAESLSEDNENDNDSQLNSGSKRDAIAFETRDDHSNSNTNTYDLPELRDGENILPGIVIAGKPIGNARQLKEAHEEGRLLSILKDLGEGIFNIERAA